MRISIFLLLLIAFIPSFSSAENQCVDIFTRQVFTVQHSIIDRYQDESLFSVQVPELIYRFEGLLSPKGQLDIIAFLTSPESGQRSNLSGKKLYKEMIEHFGLENIKSISGQWVSGTNFEMYHRAVAMGMSREEAAFYTWSGRQAAHYGFTKIKSLVERQTSLYSNEPEIHVIFVRP